MKKKIKVLSGFDGISCARVALERAGYEIEEYYASELDKYAMKVTIANYPDTKQIGDISKVKGSDFSWIDFFCGGSPCQGFSFAGKQLNFDDPRSRLLFEFVRILNELKAINPDIKFLLENVKMKKEYQDIISNLLGVQPIEINSALVSAQNRKRLYWTNIGAGGGLIMQPEDRGILLKDIVLSDAYPVALHNIYGGFKETKPRVFTEKSPTLRTAAGGDHIPSFVHRDKSLAVIASAGRTTIRECFYKNQGNMAFVKDENGLHSIKEEKIVFNEICNGKRTVKIINTPNVPDGIYSIRKFHPVECERLQTLPDNYTNHVSDTQRYKAIGNGWNVDTIVHILSYDK
jgi:DNA-cytosine methyltransferase